MKRWRYNRPDPRRTRVDAILSAVKVSALFVFHRIKEPSTWIGFGSVATSIGWAVDIDSGWWKEISLAGMGIGGVMAVLLAEPTQRM